MAAELVVAHDAPDEAVVGGGYAVVVVKVELGQGRDVDLVLLLARDAVGQAVVQPVYTFYYQDLIAGQAQPPALLGSRPGLEIVHRQEDLLPGGQAQELLVEELHVQGLQALEIGLAVRPPRGILAVEEIIVQGDGHRDHAQNCQLDGQLLGKSGLPRTGGPGHQDRLHPPAFVDAIGDLGDFLVVQSLGRLDEGLDAPGLIDAVDGPHRGDPQGAAPALVFLIDGAE